MHMTETLRLWRERWTERRLFARELDMLPDETLKDFDCVHGRPRWPVMMAALLIAKA